MTMYNLFKSPYKNIFILSLFVFLITAFFSEGYFHPDEHFQILEYCNFKLGKSAAADLPWEFHDRIRPTLQPTLAYLGVKILNFVHIYNPFSYALFFRILTAVLSWYIVSKLFLLLIKDFSSEGGKKIFIFLSLFLWFVPYLSVRFSSENLSAIAFLSSIYLILRGSDSDFLPQTGTLFSKVLIRIRNDKAVLQLFVAGLLLGFSFFFRFQIAFAILGLGLWLLLIKKMKWTDLLILIFSGICAIVICIYIDFWFYGKFELTPLNYFLANIVENKAADWGVSPWWYYINSYVLQGIPPISILLLVGFLIGLYKSPRNVFVWCLLPFLIGHIAIGHKELRFLFPVLFGFVYLASRGIDFYITRGKWGRVGRSVLIFSILINVPLLIYKMISPSQEAVSYYKFLYDYSSQRPMLLFCKESNAYDLVGLRTNFYQSPNLRCIVYNDDRQISDYLKKVKPETVFLMERKLFVDNKFEGYKKRSIFCLFPQWILNFNFNNWQSRARIWNIQELKKLNDF